MAAGLVLLTLAVVAAEGEVPEGVSAGDHAMLVRNERGAKNKGQSLIHGSHTGTLAAMSGDREIWENNRDEHCAKNRGQSLVVLLASDKQCWPGERSWCESRSSSNGFFYPTN